MNTFNEQEKHEFFQLYKKDKMLLDIFFKIGISIFGIYFFIGAVQSFLDKDFFNTGLVILFGGLIVYAINLFRCKVLYKPLIEINKNRYCVYREGVIDKKRTRVMRHSSYYSKYRTCGNWITHYYVSSQSHRNVDAVSVKNWIDIEVGDIICFVEIGKIVYAFKPKTV